MPNIPPDFVAWVACLAFAVMLFNQLTRARKNLLGGTDTTNIGPSPLVVKGEEKFVTTRECSESNAKLFARIAAIEQLRNTDLEAASYSRKNIYDEMRNMEKRIDAALVGIRAEMGELERRLNASDETRTLKLHDRLNEILGDLGEMRGEVHAKAKV